MVRIRLLLVAAHLGMGQQTAAAMHLQIAKQKATQIADNLLIALCMKYEAALLYAKQSYKAAYQASQNYHQFQDSIDRIKTKESLENIGLSVLLRDTELQNEQKKAELLLKENQLLQAEKANRRMTNGLVAALLFSVLVLIGMMVNRWKNARRIHALVHEINAQIKRLDVEAIHPPPSPTPNRASDLPPNAPFNAVLAKIAQLNEMTQRKEARFLALQATAKEKEAQLHAFNYTLGHDLKVPLRSALNLLELYALDADAAGQLKSQPYIDTLQQLLQNMYAMIDGIVEYSRADTDELDFQLFDTQEILPSILNQLKLAFPEDMARVRINLPTELPNLYGDVLLLRQAITNLLSNALKATRASPQPHISISAHSQAGRVSLSLTDNGIGISEENLARIFHLFKSGHHRSEFPGTGVGLAIVKRIIERHGGTVYAASEGVGMGAVFSIELPTHLDRES